MVKKTFILHKDCDYEKEIELIAFKCRICRHHCEMGERIMKAYERVQREIYHHKIETE